VEQGLFIVEALPSHSDTALSVGLLWTSDQPNADTTNCTTQRFKDTDIRARGGIRTHNASKQAAAFPTPETARPPGSAYENNSVE